MIVNFEETRTSLLNKTLAYHGLATDSVNSDIYKLKPVAIGIQL